MLSPPKEPKKETSTLQEGYRNWAFRSMPRSRDGERRSNKLSSPGGKPQLTVRGMATVASALLFAPLLTLLSVNA